MKLKDYANLKEMLIDFNEYSTDYTKTACREYEETITNTLKEIERLNNIIKEIKDYFEDLEIFAPSRDIKYDILDIIEGER